MQEEIKPVKPKSLATKFDFRCYCGLRKWQVVKTGEIFWSLRVWIEWKDRPKWTAENDMQVYHKSPTDENWIGDCDKWFAFIKDELKDEQMRRRHLVDYRDLIKQ